MLSFSIPCMHAEKKVTSIFIVIAKQVHFTSVQLLTAASVQLLVYKGTHVAKNGTCSTDASRTKMVTSKTKCAD